MKKFFFYTFIIIFGILQILVLPGCANMFPPEGGLRDSLPPLLVKASPPDSSKNFKSNRISFTFDEFVVVDPSKIHDELIVSPLLKYEPQIDPKLRTITVKIKDTLEPNTTYTFNFGNAIRDNNEGNVLKNFTYIFSTGSRFDSLSLRGKVITAENGKIDTTLIVMLHKSSEDSAVVKEKPRYITRLDSKGNFVFHNLPAGTFYLYALKDEGGTHNYLDGKHLFAFADKPLSTQSANEPVTLYAYAEKVTPPAPPPSTRRNITSSEKRLRPILNTINSQLDLLNDLIISFDQPLKTLDTALIHFSSDTSFVPVKGYQVTPDSTKKKLSLHYNWKENTRYNIILEKDFAEDNLGRKLLKTDTLSFKTKRLSEYGSLRLRFKNLDLSTNPVLLFTQNETIVRTIPLNSAQLSIPIFLPGEYELGILNDRNKNGKWDPGEFFGKHIQPEIVKSVDRKIIVKANWQNEFDIAL